MPVAKKKRKKKQDPWYDSEESDESNWDAMEYVEDMYEEEVPPMDDDADFEEEY